MFCQNCGNIVEDGAKFCAACGSQLQQPTPVQVETPAQQNDFSAPQSVCEQPQIQSDAYVPQGVQQNFSQPEYSAPYGVNPPVPSQPPVKPKKTSTGCIVAIIIVVALVIIGFVGLVVLGAYLTNKTDNVAPSLEYSDGEVQVEEETENPEYTDIFTSRNIVDSPDVFIGLDVRTFANVQADGTIDKMVFAYDGDTIKELMETIYYPITDYDEGLLDQLDKTMRETFDDADALENCTVTYETTNDYYVIKIHSTDMDSAISLDKLADTGVITYDGFVAYLSMNQTADGLIDQGYIER